MFPNEVRTPFSMYSLQFRALTSVKVVVFVMYIKSSTTITSENQSVIDA